MGETLSEAFKISEDFFKTIDSKLWKHRYILYLLIFGAGTLTAIGVGHLGLYEANFRLHALLELNVWYIYFFNLFVCLTIDAFFRIMRRLEDPNIKNIVASLYICLYIGIIINFINDLYYVIQAVA